MRKQPQKMPDRQRKALKLGFLVYKHAGAYAVERQSDHRFDHLGFFEGVAFRLGFGLPKRILNWSPSDGSVQVGPTRQSTDVPGASQ